MGSQRALLALPALLLAPACGDRESDVHTPVDAASDAADVTAAGGAGGLGGSGGNGATGGSAGGGGSPVDAGADAAPDAAVEAGFDAGTLCADYAQALCSHLFLCAPEFAQLYYTTITQCISEYEPLCEVSLPLPGVSPTQLAACVATVAGATCDAWYSSPQAGSCDGLGTLADGQTCVSGFQCQTGVCLLDDTINICGYCKALGTQGAACDLENDCADGYTCAGSICTEAAYLGEACGAIKPCARPMVCTNGTCEKSGGPGAPCTTTFDCDSVQGAFLCEAGTCKKPVIFQPGEACSGLTGICAYPYNCIGGVCALPSPAGAACSSHAQCEQLANFCIAGKCQPASPSFCGP